MKKVVVLGSVNLDNILSIKNLPAPGETISIERLSQAAGGKGENQAISLSRSGSHVSFLGAVGQDNVGKKLLHQLMSDGIDISSVDISEKSDTGQAYILLQKSGQNSILINHGANFLLSPDYVDKYKEAIKESQCIVTQFEIPINCIEEAFQIAKENNVTTILNPAPAISMIPESILRNTDVIIPNETESFTISGIRIKDTLSLIESAKYYHKLGIKNIVITLGKHGSFISNKYVQKLIPAIHVQAIDTTGAGDTFIGALTSQLRKDFYNLEAAAIYATRASSLCVQKKGAVPSIPKREIIEEKYY